MSSGEIKTFNLIFNWRGGRAVDRAGLENRKAERPREFESHPLRNLDYQALTTTAAPRIKLLHKGLKPPASNPGPPLRIAPESF